MYEKKEMKTDLQTNISCLDSSVIEIGILQKQTFPTKKKL